MTACFVQVPYRSRSLQPKVSQEPWHIQDRRLCAIKSHITRDNASASSRLLQQRAADYKTYSKYREKCDVGTKIDRSRNNFLIWSTATAHKRRSTAREAGSDKLSVIVVDGYQNMSRAFPVTSRLAAAVRIEAI
jgi:hypothetical protein